jgi:hypothetical protein
MSDLNHLGNVSLFYILNFLFLVVTSLWMIFRPLMRRRIIVVIGFVVTFYSLFGIYAYYNFYPSVEEQRRTTNPNFVDIVNEEIQTNRDLWSARNGKLLNSIEDWPEFEKAFNAEYTVYLFDAINLRSIHPKEAQDTTFYVRFFITLDWLLGGPWYKYRLIYDLNHQRIQVRTTRLGSNDGDTGKTGMREIIN